MALDNHYWKSPTYLGKPITIDNKGAYGIVGASIAAHHTSFYATGVAGGTMLDCSMPTQHKPRNIVVTHGHSDHCGNVHRILHNTNDTCPAIFCPRDIQTSLRDYIHSSFVLTKNTQTPRIHNKYSLTGVTIGEKLPFCYDSKIKNRVNWYLEILYCHHTVPCVGYGFSEMRSKLRDDAEFTGLVDQYKTMFVRENNPQLGDSTLSRIDCPIQDIYNRMKTDGINISREVEVPIFAFMGDTDHQALYAFASNDNKKKNKNKNIDEDIKELLNRQFSPALEKYPSIMIECTFIDDDHVGYARDDCHMHWKYLKPYIIAHPNTRFLLMHFSGRYAAEYLEKFFVNENIPNVFPIISMPYKRNNTSI